MLFINRVYPPDEGATGQLLEELAEALVKEGWRVTVLAAGSSTSDSRPSTFAVHRVRGLPFTRASFLRRALSYASLYPALLWRALRLPRHDVIVILTDPPMLLTLGPWLRFFKRSRLVHWAQDVYPEVAEELGVLRKHGLAARFLRALSTWSLRRQDHIIAVGRCMKQRLLHRGIAASRVTVIPNWSVGKSEITNQKSEDGHVAAGHPQSSIPNPQSSLSPQPFTVMYSGNFGLAHPFDSIAEAVQLLDRASAPVRFVFAGAGPRLNSLREQIAVCRNTEFRPPVPLPALSASLAAADVHLVCMSEELLGFVVPSKTYGALASRRPCIFLGPSQSEAAQTLVESACGRVFCAHQSGPDLAELLTRWSEGDSSYIAMRAACASVPSVTFSLPLAAFHQALLP